jgi:hypothetical protein
LEEYIFCAHDEAMRAAERPARRRAPIPGPNEFAINLKAYADKAPAIYFLWGHREVQGDRNKEIIPQTSSVTLSDHPDQIVRGSFSIQPPFICGSD